MPVNVSDKQKLPYVARHKAQKAPICLIMLLMTLVKD